MSIEWLPLKKGDVIQIIAPSSTTSSPKEDLKQAKEFLESWGLRVKISDLIFGENKSFPSLANSDTNRFEDLKNALLDPEVKAIWCIRGGYGAIRLIKQLRELVQPKNQFSKLFIGFSDITLLHIYLRQVWCWNTVHSFSLTQAIKNTVATEDIEKLRQLIFGGINQITINDLIPMNESATKEMRIESEITGGNLTLLSRSLSRKKVSEQFLISDRIVVLEDIEEPFRKVDGILQQLMLDDFFDTYKPAAIILGDFSINNTFEQNQVENALKEFALQLDTKKIPVLRCLNIGHGQSNHPLPFGPKATLDLGANPTLSIESGAKFSGSPH